MQSSAFDTYLLAYGKLFARRAHYLLFACITSNCVSALLQTACCLRNQSPIGTSEKKSNSQSPETETSPLE